MNSLIKKKNSSNNRVIFNTLKYIILIMAFFIVGVNKNEEKVEAANYYIYGQGSSSKTSSTLTLTTSIIKTEELIGSDMKERTRDAHFYFCNYGEALGSGTCTGYTGADFSIYKGAQFKLYVDRYYRELTCQYRLADSSTWNGCWDGDEGDYIIYDASGDYYFIDLDDVEYDYSVDFMKGFRMGVVWNHSGDTYETIGYVDATGDTLARAEVEADSYCASSLSDGYYKSLTAAINAVVPQGTSMTDGYITWCWFTITLYYDHSSSSSIVIDSDRRINLNLNYKTVTGTSSSNPVIKVGNSGVGYLHVYNSGTIQRSTGNDGSAVSVASGSSFSTKDVNIYGNANNAIYNAGTTSIDGGLLRGSNAIHNDGTVTVTNGDLLGGYCGIYNNRVV